MQCKNRKYVSSQTILLYRVAHNKTINICKPKVYSLEYCKEHNCVCGVPGGSPGIVGGGGGWVGGGWVGRGGVVTSAKLCFISSPSWVWSQYFVHIT